ncbi:MAG: hypothetical protein FD147_2015 [Chloroflexi bacterium]|nr:MAG: hypothetical protein FD147_2015 [Chloroflexota bacterium]
MKTTMVYVPALLGCIARGTTTEEALRNTRKAITTFLTYLGSHDEDIDVVSPFELTIAAHVIDGPWIGYGDPTPGFVVDFEPLTTSDHRRYISHLGFIQGDLLKIAQTLPMSELIDNPPNGQRSIFNILAHIAESQGTYLRYLTGSVEVMTKAIKSITPSSDLHITLSNTFGLITSRLQRLTPVEFKQLVPHGQVTWSARRCFRRALEYGWEHLCEICERLLIYNL